MTDLERIKEKIAKKLCTQDNLVWSNIPIFQRRFIVEETQEVYLKKANQILSLLADEGTVILASNNQEKVAEWIFRWFQGGCAWVDLTEAVRNQYREYAAQIIKLICSPLGLGRLGS